MHIVCPAPIKAQIPNLLWDIELERVAVFVGHVNEETVHIEAILEAKNMHHDPYNHFALKKPQWETFHHNAALHDMKVVGLAHSHPEGHPARVSAYDLRFAQNWPQVLCACAVFHSPTGQLIWYDRQGEISREILRLPLGMRVANRLMK